MKLTRKHGSPAIWYDELMDRMLKEALAGHQHECDESCDPPGEREMLDWYESLSERQRLLLRFAQHLHANGFRLGLEHWSKPPIEAMPTRGKH